MAQTLAVAQEAVDDPVVGAGPCPHTLGVAPRRLQVADVGITVPAEVRDLLVRDAAAKGVSLRTYLAHLADSLRTPEERAARKAASLAMLKAWNGFDPTPEQLDELGSDLRRQLAQAEAGQ
jgi:hypothetical protein